MGSCVAGGAYLPIMSDEAIIVEGTGYFPCRKLFGKSRYW
jgi:acetyl-CoA carboxylase carboxyltransferase component